MTQNDDATLVDPMPDGRPMYYMLDDDDNPVPWTGTLLSWSAWLSALHPSRRFIRWSQGGSREGRSWEVRTVFLGVDDAAATVRPADGPEVFGTLVTGGDDFFDTTKEAALARHDRIVEKLKQGLSLDNEEHMDGISRLAKRVVWRGPPPEGAKH